MNTKLKGKVAAITGGNSGIGLAAAKEYALQGAKVAIFARSQEKADQAITAIDNGAIGFVGDVTDLPSIEAFYKGVGEKFGKIDIVFANAGIADRGIIEEVDEAVFDKMINVNFKGVFFTIKYVLPHLRKNASVVLVGSCVDEMGMEGLSVYSATKAAVRSLARSFTPELKKLGARINVLSPGPVITDIEKKAGFSIEEVESHRKMIENKLPVGRMGQPEEMAKVALFLASDDSSFMYGSEVQVDGGMNQTRWQG